MNYTFNISLSILNHLGRNLYRNFITVIGEAISNSWDADAQNVWIEIDRENRTMFIVDDGIGMSDSDFQNKFLKIGHSKRNSGIESAKKRPYIGRKGIGKLALLSCASKIHIASKAIGQSVIGGLIDNSELDKAISDDVSADNYPLEVFNPIVSSKLDDLSSGTAIYFEKLNDGVINTIEYLKKAIALYFRFSLIDETFSIHLNGEPITLDALNDLASTTQFVWQINAIDDAFLKDKISIQSNKNIANYALVKSNVRMRGFVATVSKPSNLKIRATNEKVTLDLFVNGRLREKDLLKHMPTARIVESYIYGQIHYDALDYEKDAFTSSREGVVSDDLLFCEFLKELESIVREIIERWDGLRLKLNQDGDSDNNQMPRKQRKARELYSETVNEIIPPDVVPPKGIIERWLTKLGEEAQFNIPSYAECFIIENLLREYIRHNDIELSKEANRDVEKWRKTENDNKNKANISYEIRQDNNDLQYLDMDGLANLVDKPENQDKQSGISRDAKVYKPVRDAVAHTSLITDNAKSHLNLTSTNVKARLNQLLKDDKGKSKSFEMESPSSKPVKTS
jgi:hypothetical protein